jgi:hypothetical protein
MMNRRNFIKVAACGSVGAGMLGGCRSMIGTLGTKPFNIRDLFESDDEAVLALSQRIFDKCILEKIQPPVEPLLHTWVVPGGPYYKGQWIWDTMFVVDLLSFLPEKKSVIREIFQNYWDFQDRRT